MSRRSSYKHFTPEHAAQNMKLTGMNSNIQHWWRSACWHGQLPFANNRSVCTQHSSRRQDSTRFLHSINCVSPTLCKTSESSHAVCAAPFISPEILKRESKKVGQHQHFERNVNKQNDILVTPTNQCSWLLVGRQNKHLSRKKLITIVGDLEIVGLVLW